MVYRNRKELLTYTRGAARAGVLIDQQGKVIREGDDIMYLTVTGSSVGINYGKVVRLRKSDNIWNPWSIKVYRVSDPYNSKPVNVTLKNPVIFKCNERLRCLE